MRWRGITLLSAAIFVALAVSSSRRWTPTIDEFAHLPAGCVQWRQGNLELYAKTPPLLRFWIALPVALDPRVEVPRFEGRPLGWGPWDYGERFLQANRARYLGLFFRARSMVIPLGLATGALIFFWTRRLFGECAAAVTASTFYLSPTVIAHSSLATIDAGCMLSVLLAAAALAVARTRGGSRPMALAGAALGLALAMKFTAVLLVPALLGLALFARTVPLRTRARDAALLLLAALFVVNLASGFRGSLQRLDAYSFRSGFCRALQQRLPGILPVPLPSDYVAGFDAQKRDTEAGEFGSYLHGRWSEQGFWQYNLVALALKTPLPVLLLLLAGVAGWRRSGVGLEAALVLLVPAASLFLFLTLFNRLNVGVRYLLPLLPFLHIVGGAVFASRRAWSGPLAWLLIGVAGVTGLRAHPDHLGYFNLLAGGMRHGHEWLLDSNLDWGQDLYRLPEALPGLHPQGPIGLLYFGHVDPTLYGIDYLPLPPRPVAGLLAVSVSFVMGQPYRAPAPQGKVVWVAPDHLRWLRDETPVAKLGSIWIYDTRRQPAGGTKTSTY